MSYPADVIPLHCAITDGYEPEAEALRLGPGDISATEVDTGTRAKRKAARDRLFIPSMTWPELAAVVAAGMSGRAAGLWLAIRLQAKLEGTDWVRVRRHLRETSASPTAPPTRALWRSWSGPA